MEPLSSPALERARQKFEASRMARQDAAGIYQVFGMPRTGQTRHQAPLRLAFKRIEDVKPLYMLVRYCDGCKRGYPVEIVREVPDGTPSAGELGLKQARPWVVECKG